MRNNYEIRGSTVAIFVNKKGEPVETLIDIDDLERVKQLPHSLYMTYGSRESSCRVYTFLGLKPRKKSLYLHRFIMGSPKNMLVDHINGNTLDNRKCNLRIVNMSENQQNRRGPQTNNTSGIRGVSWDNRKKKWNASLTVNGCVIRLGKFSDKNKAAEVVAEGRRKYMTHSEQDKVISVEGVVS